MLIHMYVEANFFGQVTLIQALAGGSNNARVIIGKFDFSFSLD